MGWWSDILTFVGLRAKAPTSSQLNTTTALHQPVVLKTIQPGSTIVQVAPVKTPAAPLPAPVVITAPAIKPTVPGNGAMGDQAPLTPPATGTFVNDFKQVTTAPAGSFEYANINIDWRSTNPARGKFDWSSVLTALDALPPSLQGAAVRRFAGQMAPLSWASSICGTVTLPNKQGTKHPNLDEPGTVQFLRYWSAEYAQLEQEYWTAFAQQFDNDERIIHVCQTAGASWTGEVMNTGGDTDVRQALQAAGCTDAALNTMWMNGIGLFASVFKRTNVLMCISPTASIDNPAAAGSTTAAAAVLLKFKGAFGARGIIANQGFTTASVGGGSDIAVQTMMAAQGGQIEGQAGGPSDITPALIALMLKQRVTQFEPFPTKAAGGSATYDPQLLVQCNQQFIANAA